MYKCDKCGNSTKHGEAMNKLVVKTRKTTYPHRTYQREGRIIEDKGGTGTEIVKEIKVCKKCLAEEK